MAHASPRTACVHVLTISDTRTPESDTSGRLCRELCEAAGHVVVGYDILPDEPERVRERCRMLVETGEVDAILLNGGTGISARDTTIEAVAGLLDKVLDGFGELFRMLSFQEIGSKAMASRAVGGVARSSLVFAMPGSTKAVRLAMEKLIVPELGHLTGELKKQG